MNFRLSSVFYCSIVGLVCLLALHRTPELPSNSYRETRQEDTYNPTPQCASDHLSKLDLERHPDRRILWNSIEGRAYDFFSPSNPQLGEKNQWTIPVVVHIISDDNTEDISEQAVVSTIAKLNAGFANSGPYNQSSGIDTGIRFCLAKQDPDGNPTNGINRIQSALTNMDAEEDDLALKNLSRWDPTCYLNIWVVNNISPGYAGYAYFPYLHGSDVDGVVVVSNVFGGSSAFASVLVHECGHYLGLYHTFQGGCKNDDCLQDGDRVCDTPPDNSPYWLDCNEPHNSCTTDAQSGLLIDQNDHLNNFMDYVQHQCHVNFTAGQSERMQYFLTGIRGSLLNCPGCLNPCPNPITVDIIEPDDLSLELGEQLRLRALVNNADRLEWFINGTPAGAGSELIYTAEQSGVVFIRVRGLSDDPNCLPKEDFIRISVECPTYVEIEEPDGNVPVGQEIQLVARYDDAFQGVEWQLENGEVIGTEDTLRHIFLEEGFQVIYLIAKSVNTGCGNTKRLYVTYAYCSGADLKITSPEFTIVSATEVTTIAAQNEYGRELSWYINDELVSTQDSFTYIFPDIGDFEIKLVGSPIGVNCSEVIAIHKVFALCGDGGRVSIWEPFSFEDIFVGEPYLFGATIHNIDIFEWYVDGELAGEEEQLEYTFEEAGTHEVVLFGQNSIYPCIQDRDTIQVLVEYDCYQRLIIRYQSQEAKLFEPVTYTAYSVGVQDIQWFVDGELVGEGDTLTYTFSELRVHQLQLRGKSLYEACPNPSWHNLSIFVSCPPHSARILTPDTVFVGEEFWVDTELQGPLNLEWSVHSPFNSRGTYIGAEPTFPFILNEPFTYEFRLSAQSVEVRCGRFYDDRSVVAVCEPPSVFSIEASKDSIEVGEELHLKANTGEQIGQVYWRINGEIREIGKDFYFSSAEEGVYEIFLENHVSVHGAIGCPRLKKKKLVAVYCPASVGIETVPDTVDAGANLILEANSYNTTDLQWQINGVRQSQGGTTLTVDFDSVGLYEITISAGSEFTACLTDTVQIFSYCPPAVIPIEVENTTVGVGQEIVFSVPTDEWDSLLWYNNEQLIGTGASVIQVFDNAGTYEISVSNVGPNPICGAAEGVVLIESKCAVSGNIFFDRQPYSNEPFEVAAVLEQAWDSLRWYLNGEPLGVQQPSFEHQVEVAGFYDFAVDVFYKGCVNRLHESTLYTEIPDRCRQEDLVGFHTLSDFGYAGYGFMESKQDGYYLRSDHGLMKLDQNMEMLWTTVHDFELVAWAEDSSTGEVLTMAKVYEDQEMFTLIRPLLLKYSKDGSLIWKKEIQSDTLKQTAKEKLIPLSDARYLWSRSDDFAGEFSVCSLLDTNGETIWAKHFSGLVISDLALTEEQTIAIVARTTDSKGIVLLKMNLSGELVWYKSWNSSDWPDHTNLHHLLGPVVTPIQNGQLAVSWTQHLSTGYLETRIAKLDKDGAFIETMILNDDGLFGQVPLDLVTTAGGGFLLASYALTEQYEYGQMYLTKFNLVGEIVWQHKKLLEDGYFPRDLTVLEDRRIVLMGDDDYKSPYLRILNEFGHPSACPYQLGTSTLNAFELEELEEAIAIADYPAMELIDYQEHLPDSPFEGNPKLNEVCVSPGTSALDLTLELNEASVCDGRLTISFNVCNIGQLGTQEYFPLSLYAADPTKTAIEPFRIAHILEEMGIPADTCLQLSLSTVNIPEASTIFALVNDDGLRQLPLDLLAITEDPLLAECSFLNNLDSIQIDTAIAAPLGLGEDLRICVGQEVVLEANAGFETYEWQSNLELPCTNCRVLTLQPSQSMEIRLKATTSVGCSSQDTIQIQVLEPNNVEQAIEICTGDSTLIFGEWRHETGIYEQSFTGSNGCDSTVQVNLSIYPPTEVQSEISPTCFGQANGEIRLIADGDMSAYSIRWSTGASGNLLPGLAAGNYQYTLTDSQGCESRGEVAIPNLEDIFFDLDWQDPACQGEASGSITLTPISEGLTFSLDGQNFQTSGSFDELASGDYTIWIRDLYGCERSTTVELVEPEPLVLEIPSILSINKGDTIPIVIEGQVDRISSIQWTPAEGLSCTDCLNPLASPDADIVYEINITDDQGCLFRSTITVEVKVVSASSNTARLVGLDPPTAFSPNGDGANDYFEIRGLERFPKCSLVVVDRSGQVVYESNPYGNDWDGRRLDGSLLPEGTYYYVLDLKKANLDLIRGPIALIR